MSMADTAAQLLLAQAAENGVSACRMKDSTLVCVTRAMLQKLLNEAKDKEQEHVLIMIKHGPTIGLT